MAEIIDYPLGERRCKTCRSHSEKTWVCRKKEGSDEYDYFEEEYCPKCPPGKPPFYPPGHPKEGKEE